MRCSRHVAAPARGWGWGRAPRGRAWLGAVPKSLGQKPEPQNPPRESLDDPRASWRWPKPPPGTWRLPAQAPKGKGQRKDEPKTQKSPQKCRDLPPGWPKCGNQPQKLQGFNLRLAKMGEQTLKTSGIYTQVGQNVGSDPKNSRDLPPSWPNCGN